MTVYRAPMTDLKTRLLAGMLAATMIFGFAACSDDSDSDGDMLSTCEIEAIARRHGYRKVQHDHREGVIAFSRPMKMDINN